MGRPPGGGKTPGSGIKKGYVHKKTQLVTEKAEELGVDPFQILLHIAANQWEALGLKGPDEISIGLQYKAASDCCQYIHPKRATVTLSGDGQNPLIQVFIDDSTKKIHDTDQNIIATEAEVV